ncbi:MAG: hypothetical protein JO120_03530 [Solirubrobacterales bacterium]|nr:hypothetical protein [Solirubrobacterales bacterium]
MPDAGSHRRAPFSPVQTSSQRELQAQAEQAVAARPYRDPRYIEINQTVTIRGKRLPLVAGFRLARDKHGLPMISGPELRDATTGEPGDYTTAVQNAFCLGDARSKVLGKLLETDWWDEFDLDAGALPAGVDGSGRLFL